MLRLLLVGLITTVAAVPSSRAQGDENDSRWEKDIRRFEERIADGRSRSEGLLFLGSSSIRMWDMGKWFPDRPVVNHGFGGSEIADSIHFFDRIVTPLKPRTIILYAGDNDIANGKSAEVVLEDFRTFAGLVREKTGGDTQLLFIAIKPSIRRWSLREEMKKANHRIQAECRRDASLTFVDVWAPMLDENGEPQSSLFLEDGLHLNEAGYRLWTSLVKKAL